MLCMDVKHFFGILDELDGCFTNVEYWLCFTIVVSDRSSEVMERTNEKRPKAIGQ